MDIVPKYSWEDRSIPKTVIEGVFFHENQRYSVITKDSNNLKIVSIPTYNRSLPKLIFTDVGPNENMWYSCSYQWNSFTGDVKGDCEIHIRNTKDIVGGSWNHGKFGQGSTIRID